MASHDLEESFGADDSAFGGVEPADDGARAESLAMLVWLSELSRDERIRTATQLGHPEVLNDPRTIGRYRLETLLGTGGYGAVFRAIDCQLNRPVALKLAWPSIMVDPEASRRFVEEPRTTAALAHEGIVDVRDSGMIELVPFIALELIEGPTLAQWMARENPMRLEVAAEIIRYVAAAVHYAHEHGIIHRDLKPSNILLSPSPGRTNLPFQPMVTDFGLARRPPGIELSLVTGTSVIIGTDPYLSPEQAAGNAANTGPASDIFSLGVILYELVANRRPFESESAVTTRHLIQNEEPPRIGDLRRGVPRDLETIILKCLEKVPNRRYESAGDLACDLGRFLNHTPILARRASLVERARKYARRNPMKVALVSTFLSAGVLAASLIGGWVADRMSAARQIAAAETTATEADASEKQYRYATGIRNVAEAFRRGKRGEVMQRLDECSRIAREPTHRGIEWTYLREEANQFERSLSAHEGGVHDLDWSPKGDLVVSCGKDGRVVVWDTATWQRRTEFDGKVGEINVVRISPDGSLLAIAGDDGRLVVRSLTDGVVIYDDTIIRGRILCLTWLGDSGSIAVGGDGAIMYVINAHTGAVRQTESLPGLDLANGGPAFEIKKIRNLVWIPETRAIAVITFPSRLHIIDAESLKDIRTWEFVASTACYVPAGKGCLAVRCELPGPRWMILLWSISEATILGSVKVSEDVMSLKYSHANGVLVGGLSNGAVQTWHVEDLLNQVEPRGKCFLSHDSQVAAIDVSPDGSQILSGGEEGNLRLFHVASQLDPFDIALDEKPRAVQFSRCGRWLSIIVGKPGAAGRAVLFDVRSGRFMWQDAGLLTDAWAVSSATVDFSPTGEELAALRSDLSISIHDAVSGDIKRVIACRSGRQFDSIEFSPDGQSVVARDRPVAAIPRGPITGLESVQIDLRSGGVASCVPVQRPRCLGWHTVYDRNFYMEMLGSRELVLCESPSGPPLHRFKGPKGLVSAVTVSADRQYLVAGGDEGIVFLWKIGDGTQVWRCIGHDGPIVSLEFSPDSQTILSRGADGTVRFWDTATQLELIRLGSAEQPILTMGLHPSGQLLVLGVEHRGRYGLQIRRLGRDAELVARDFEFAAALGNAAN